MLIYQNQTINEDNKLLIDLIGYKWDDVYEIFDIDVAGSVDIVLVDLNIKEKYLNYHVEDDFFFW